VALPLTRVARTFSLDMGIILFVFSAIRVYFLLFSWSPGVLRHYAVATGTALM
jgi:hypothetical protein